jgi:hypothetical protein
MFPPGNERMAETIVGEGLHEVLKKNDGQIGLAG